jgi:hypothetical protein
MPTYFPELDRKSVAELELMHAYPECVSDFALQHALVAPLLQRRELLLAEAVAVGAALAGSAEQLAQRRAAQAALRGQLAARLGAFDALAARQAAVLRRFSVDEVSRALGVRMNALDAEGDALSEAYLEQDVDSDGEEEEDESDDDVKVVKKDKADARISHSSFVKQFLAKRREFHELAARREWLGERYGCSPRD